MTVDVVCFGETMALITPDPPLPLVDAEHLRLSHAGAESNVAINLARLGSSVLWCSRLGDDPLGHRLLADISATGVGTDCVRFTATAPTGLMLKSPGVGATSVLYYRSGSAASTMDASDVERALAARPRLLHLTGITPALSASCSDAVDLAFDRARAAGIEISFDVNYRPALWPDRDTAADRLCAAAGRADIVFVGLDEATALWDVTTAAAVRTLINAPTTVVVKDGGHSAYSFDRTARTEVPALPVEVLEPVGAGDAFAAGWLHGHLVGMNPIEQLRLGHLLAATTLISPTDQGRPAAGLEKLARADAPWPPTEPAEPQ